MHLKKITKFSALTVLLLLTSGFLLSACSGDNVAERMARASTYVASGDFRSATIELKNVLQKQPENAKAWFTLGQVSLEKGAYADAAHQFRRARKYGTNQQKLTPLLARALIGQKRFSEALDVLQPETATSGEARAAIYTLRGRSYLGLQKAQQAQKAFTAALAAQANYAPALVGQARVAWQLDKAKQAVSLLAQATQSDPTYARAWSVSEKLAFNQKRCDSVVDAFTHIQDIGINTLAPAPAFMARGYAAHCQLIQGQVDKAGDNIDVLMKMAPEHPYANYLSALLAYHDKNYEQATSYVQKTLATVPDSTPGTLLLGMIKVAQGNLQNAQFYFTEVVSKSPDNLKARQLLASVYIERGLPGQAVKVLKQALEGNKPNSQLLAMLGEASLRAGQQNTGIQYLKRSALGSPDNAHLQMAVAHRMGQAGDVDDALQLLDQMQPDSSGDTVKAAVLRLTLYLRNGQAQTAIAEAQKLFRSNPDDLRYVRLLARVYSTAGQLENARTTLQQAIKANPDNMDLRLDLGLLALSNGNPEAARDTFLALLNADPDNARAAVALAKTAARQGQKAEVASWLEKAVDMRPDSIKLQATLARVYLAQQRPQDALPVTQALVEDAPDNIGLHQLRIAALWAAGKHAQAEKSLRDTIAMAQQPNATALRLALAQMLVKQKDLESAIQTLEKAQQQNAGSVKVAAMLAKIQLEHGDAEAALATAEDLRKSGKKVAAAMLTGDLRNDQGQYKAAAQAYAKAYAKRPTRELALRLFEVRRHGDLPQPGRSLMSWLDQHPDDIAASMALAQWHQATGAHDAAADQYRKILTNHPDNPIALNNLAMIYFMANDSRAVKLAQRAHEQVPESPAVTDTLGWILVNSGDIKQGLSFIRQAAAAAPKQADIQYHLAAALVRLEGNSEHEEAKRILNNLLASDISFASRSDAKALLQQMQK